MSHRWQHLGTASCLRNTTVVNNHRQSSNRWVITWLQCLHYCHNPNMSVSVTSVSLDWSAIAPSGWLLLLLLSQQSGHHKGGGRRRRRRWGVHGREDCYASSRSSLIAPGDCAAGNCDHPPPRTHTPPPLYADGAVSSIMGRGWLKLHSVELLLITWVLWDGLRVTRLNVRGLCGVSKRTCSQKIK